MCVKLSVDRARCETLATPRPKYRIQKPRISRDSVLDHGYPTSLSLASFQGVDTSVGDKEEAGVYIGRNS